MNQTAELRRLLARAERVAARIAPPEISLLVWREGIDPKPEATGDFTVRICIESLA